MWGWGRAAYLQVNKRDSIYRQHADEVSPCSTPKRQRSFQPGASSLILHYSSACQPLETITHTLKPSLPPGDSILYSASSSTSVFRSNASETRLQDAMFLVPRI